MPNIEIHGAGPAQADKLHNKISALLGNATYRDDVVVSTVDDVVIDLDGKSRPFLRVIFAENDVTNNPVDLFNDCLQRLTEFNMDTEVVIIRRFIPKKN